MRTLLGGFPETSDSYCGNRETWIERGSCCQCLWVKYSLELRKASNELKTTVVKDTEYHTDVFGKCSRFGRIVEKAS